MRLAVILPLLGFALSQRLVLARGDGTFEGPFKLKVPSPVAATTGDFNRDGKRDLALVGGSSSVTVLLQSPGSRLSWKVEALTAGTGNFSVHAADLDADGNDDLVTADPASTVQVLRSNGDGTFTRPLPLPGSQGAREVAIGDWDGDGVLDLAAACHGLSVVPIYRGAGDGTFALLKKQVPSGEPHDIDAFDYDGDGKTEIMVGVPTGVIPLRRRADGTFFSAPPIGTLGSGQSFSAGDFDGDRRPDLITHAGSIMVGLNKGKGLFRTTFTLSDSRVMLNWYDGYSPGLADLNDDGNLDLAFSGAPGLLVYPGKGDGTFKDAVVFPSANSILTAADVDGDGHPDVVSASPPGLSIFWGKPVDPFLEVGRSLSGFVTPRAVGLGDLDRDGFPDLFFPDPTQPRVAVYLKAGTRSSTAPSLMVQTANRYTALDVADLDLDGVPDLAGASLAGGTALVALLDPNGRVRNEAALPAGLSPAAVAVGTIDEGSSADLAVPCTGSDHLAVFLGQGGGAFAPAREVPTIERPRDVTLGDLDGDGRTDLAVVSQGAAAVHFGAGDGAFSQPVVLVPQETRTYSRAAIADLDQDGREDLLVAEQRRPSVIVYRGKGGRELEEGTAVRLSTSPLGLVLADLDEDGYPDIAVPESGQSVTVLLNRGLGGLAEKQSYPLGFRPLSLLAADMDLDGAIDLVACSNDAALILPGRLAPGTPRRFRRGDVDADGAVKVNDPVLVLAHLFLGQGPLACEDAADLNDDGRLSLSDPIAVLSWLFLGGDPPPAPGPGVCGGDPTADLLRECGLACR